MNQAPSILLNCLLETDRLALKPKETIEQSTYEIVDVQTGQILGTVRQENDHTNTVEIFWGKGGFMGLVISPQGLRYFVLPGGSLALGGTYLDLYGEPLSGNFEKKPSEGRVKQPERQSITHQAMILGAGLATRFERISGDSTQYAKPAVPLIGSRSVIACLAHHLAQQGISRLIVNTFFKPDSLKSGLANIESISVSYIDEVEPSGTAGGLRKIVMKDAGAHAISLDMNEPLLILQGDAVTDVDFSDLLAAHMEKKALVTIGCQRVSDNEIHQFGVIVTDCSGTDGESGQIIDFQEKPSLKEARSRLANTGFYVFSPAVYPIIQSVYQKCLAVEQETARLAGKPIPSEVLLDFAMDIFPEVLSHSKRHPEDGYFWAQQVYGYWSDIGNPVQYFQCIHDIYAGKVNLTLPDEVHHYYHQGIIYWEGAAEKAKQEGAILSGNVLVALPFQ